MDTYDWGYGTWEEIKQEAAEKRIKDPVGFSGYYYSEIVDALDYFEFDSCDVFDCLSHKDKDIRIYYNFGLQLLKLPRLQRLLMRQES